MTSYGGQTMFDRSSNKMGLNKRPLNGLTFANVLNSIRNRLGTKFIGDAIIHFVTAMLLEGRSYVRK